MDWLARLSWLSTNWRDAIRPRENRVARFRQILLAALQTRAYRQPLERAGLAEPGAIERLRSIEEALRKLPCVSWAEYHGSPTDFHNPTAPAPARRRFRCPIAREIRTAVLAPWFAESASARVFRPGWTDQIRKFRPEAIAAPADVLKRLAESRWAEIIPTPIRAITVFRGLEHGALSELERESLWQVFEAPMFEQCLGADGALLAWECEAHDGLHAVEENAIFEQSPGSEWIVTSLTDRRHPALRLTTCLAARLGRESCGCGRPGLRLMGLPARPVGPSPRTMTAASGD